MNDSLVSRSFLPGRVPIRGRRVWQQIVIKYILDYVIYYIYYNF